MAEVTERTCVICGANIGHRAKRSIVCGDPCARKRQQESVLRYRSRNKAAHQERDRIYKRRTSGVIKANKKCQICGNSLADCHGLAVTCSETCKSEYKLHKKHEYADRRRQLERNRYSIRKTDPEYLAYRRSIQKRRRDRDPEAHRQRKRNNYAANRARILLLQKIKRDANLETHRKRSRDRTSARSAAIKILQELEAQGLEALL
ncbi:hypothetical protein [Ancylobacter radicis]|uniref:DUF2116 family Zn-ribbon domain-containing protein n=1 Tax=Ancylobacter radicis TaxID=2836179 RepID=A0ABS5R5N0_9HYPH|nr:hypothetical protein [Ancylobacter radicis]MBS9476191.1 hypothetical protein [Ancylobacter radicis]